MSVMALLLVLMAMLVVVMLLLIGLYRRRQALSEEQLRYLLKEQSADNLRQLQAVREELARIVREQMAENRMELSRRVEDMRKDITSNQALLLQQLLETLNQNLLTTNELQREKLEVMTQRQEQLVQSTEKRLDDMRLMVEEKLQKTLNERIGQSFELVRTQLENVQRGLGEMKNLAEDVGGLKKVLGNVKTRGTFGEIQLAALLEQMLSPEQYEANVKTRKNATEFVEFAIKLPGKDNGKDVVYLPIDAKFPKDVYEQYIDAYEAGDTSLIESTSKQLEITIKRMAKDIHDKYVEPPFTTDFAIMFLPFENIYAEVIRRTSLIETLQKDFKKVMNFTPAIVQSGETGTGLRILVVNDENPDGRALIDNPRELDDFESHRVYVDQPSGSIVLHGKDMRGTIYAIYSFSERILGVPPLWYWCSWQPEVKESIQISANYDYFCPSPQVRYRA